VKVSEMIPSESKWNDPKQVAPSGPFVWHFSYPNSSTIHVHCCNDNCRVLGHDSTSSDDSCLVLSV